ncbi:MAG: hypothetical protein NC092_02460 [Butyrivibrio sp.]|nr:hypothetical protein [Muribaculum sp.]MCM1551535.1 hypothetical protein [Butyrivibrio sp.]
MIVYVMTLIFVGSAAYWGSVTLFFLAQLAIFVLCFLIVYNASLVAVTVSGNASNAFVNLMLHGLIVAGAYAIIYANMNAYYENFYYDTHPILEDIICALTPLVSVLDMYLAFTEGHFLTSSYARPTILAMLYMVFNFLLAMYLHRKRPSELAERGLENKFFAIPFRFAGSCLAGLAFSLLFKSSGRKWALFWALFATIFTFAVLNILYHASFKKIFAHKRQLGLAVALTCGTVLFFAFDLSGYNTYLPDKEEITGLAMQVDSLWDTGYFLQKTQNGNYARIFPDTLSYEPMFDDQEEIYQLLQAMTSHHTRNHDNSDQGYHVSVRVFTKGRSYCRSYVFYMTESDRELIRPFIESESFRTYYYPASTGELEPPMEIRVTSLDGISFDITDSERINELYRAYSKDFQEHYSMEEEKVFSYVDLDYKYPTDSDGGKHLIDMGVCPWYENTLTLLKKWYPNMCWGTDDLTLHSLLVTISTEASSGSPSDASGIHPSSETHTYQNVTVDDPETLNELQPLLTISKSKVRNLGSKYIYIGVLDASTDTSEHITYYAYMERDTVPQELRDIMGIAE